MKKIIVMISLFFMVLTFFSCEKYCTCVKDDVTSSIEISPDESCSSYSSSENGQCQ